MDCRSASSTNSRKATRVVGAGGNASSGGDALGVRDDVDAAVFALPWFFLLLGLMMCWQVCVARITRDWRVTQGIPRVRTQINLNAEMQTQKISARSQRGSRGPGMPPAELMMWQGCWACTTGCGG